MSTCRQKVEIFVTKKMWDKTPIDQYYDKKKTDHLRVIQTDNEGDFDIDFKKKWVELGFGYLKTIVPKDAFLIEVGRAFTDEVCGKNFVSHIIEQDRKERKKRRFWSWFTKQKRNQ